MPKEHFNHQLFQRILSDNYLYLDLNTHLGLNPPRVKFLVQFLPPEIFANGFQKEMGGVGCSEGLGGDNENVGRAAWSAGS